MSSTDPVAAVEVPVLVIGGSLVGLSTSMFLAQHGVDVLSVEKHHGTAIHPRAGYFQLRTIELMRIAGIEDRVRAAALELYDPDGGLNAVETLAGREIANYIPNINGGVEDVSPARRLFMPQQVLEPLLLQRAREFGARFQYSTELVGYEQDDDRRDGDGSQRRRRQRARDPGAIHGRLRRQPQSDPREPRHRDDRTRAAVAQRHDLLPRRLLGSAPRPEPRRDLRQQPATFAASSGWRRPVSEGSSWCSPSATSTSPGPASLPTRSPTRWRFNWCATPSVTLICMSMCSMSTSGERSQRLPTHSSKGRIFIAGDAAHTMPPTGGFGGNTGIQDAHNIAWKLAWCLQGKAGPALVDTYDQERQPAGMQAIEQAYNRYVLRSDPDLGTEGMHEAIPDMHVEFNRYRSTAVIPDPDYVDDGALDIDPRQSYGLPGTRAPHVELSGRARSCRRSICTSVTSC